LKVLIDDGLSSLTNITGVGQHGYNVYKNLHSFCDCDITNYWYLKGVPRGLRKFTYEALTNIHSLYRSYDLIHYQNHFIPHIQGKAKRVVTIHDLSVFRFPETVPTFYLKHNQANVVFAAKNADAIITPSEFTKTELISYFPWIDAGRVFSCESGLREIFFRKNIISNILEKNNLISGDYLFFLGSLTKRKNLEFLLTSFIKARQTNAINKNTQLVLAGQNWWGANDVEKLISPEFGILKTGYLNDEDIVVLYRNSKAVVFPSIYEGFGTPIIEAMSQNVPIIISNIPTSQTLNTRHNNQMMVFNINDEDGLIDILRYVDSDGEKIKASLNYGNISKYNYEIIAKNHYQVYKILLK
jgi:glycosyltransferase involved in cell wall biosynthesis